MPRLAGDQVKRLRPIRPSFPIGRRADNAPVRRPAFNDRRAVNRAHRRHRRRDSFGRRRPTLGIELVQVKPLRLPVFMQQNGQVEGWLPLQPIHVGTHLRRPTRAIIAVQVHPGCVFAGLAPQAGRVQARADPQGPRSGPGIGLQQGRQRQRPGRFVAVDAGRQVHPLHHAPKPGGTRRRLPVSAAAGQRGGFGPQGACRSL